MIDMHTHILPGIDDGSSSTAESLEIIRFLMSKGIDTIILTPHYYSYEKTIAKFLEDRENAYSSLQECLNINNVTNLNLKLGAEVLLDVDLQYNEDITKLAIEGTDYILLEMPYRIWEDWIYEAVQNITAKYKLKVIIPHIERYVDIHNDIVYINELLELPDVYAQMNIGDLVSSSKKSISKKMLTNNYIQFLGTDIHTPAQMQRITEGIEVLNTKLDTPLMQMLNANSHKLIHNQSIEKQATKSIRKLLGKIYI